jgi:hypothetical protein
MDEQIEKLKEQCFYKEAVDFDYDQLSRIYTRFDGQKFAELIIRQCAELCTDAYYTPDGYGITTADQRCADKIKEYFGVK